VSHSQSAWERIATGGGRFLVVGNDGLVYDGKDVKKAWDTYLRHQKYQLDI
jgi:hypothetical protein